MLLKKTYVIINCAINKALYPQIAFNSNLPIQLETNIFTPTDDITKPIAQLTTLINPKYIKSTQYAEDVKNKIDAK